MKRFAIVMMVALWAIQLQASPIGEAKAQQNVWTFLEKRHAGTKDGRRGAPYKAPRLTRVKATAAYYAFNLGSGGFVIAAADDAVEPVLGYSDTGTFPAEDMPEGSGHEFHQSDAVHNVESRKNLVDDGQGLQ